MDSRAAVESVAHIFMAKNHRHFHIAGLLIREYVDSLAIDLTCQQFDSELHDLRRMYGPPEGALFLLRVGQDVCGCVGVRKACGRAELKRLYVRPHARGRGFGKNLCRRAIAFAARLGHDELYLDTLPSMKAAHLLYRELGFVATESYTANAVAGAAFMVKRLKRQ